MTPREFWSTHPALGFHDLGSARADEKVNELMGMQVGQIRAGYLADLLLVEADPLVDIGVLQDKSRMRAIMKGGQFHKMPAAA